MQATTPAYAAAIVADYRRIQPRVLIDIVDPDIVYAAVSASGEAPFSRSDQLFNKQLTVGEKYITLEPDRWRLDGSFHFYPDTKQQIKDEHGFVGNVQSDEGGALPTKPYVQLNVSQLSIMQACSIHFTGRPCDGHATHFRIDVYSGASIVYTKTVADNQSASVYFDGFTVKNITAIRATFNQWSMANRYIRLVEIIPGIYEKWEGDSIYSIDVLQETALSCMTTPYGSCTLQVHNKGKRFNPYNRTGLFQSLEERQGMAVAFGVELENGSTEYLPLGSYYQKSGGWETDAYGLTITFKLVDIVGLLADRDFIVPTVLPATLGGWIGALVSQLGDNFKSQYTLSPALAQTALTANAEALKNTTCGTLLRYLSMASRTYFCADNQTGKLKLCTPTTAGLAIDEDNMNSYPKNKPADSIAQITFRLADTAKTEYVVSGTQGDKSLSISNPFIHTKAQADVVARFILSAYGLSLFTVSGRGDMRCELGDVDTLATGFGDVAMGRRYKQQFKLTEGIMKNVPSYLLEVPRV